MENQNIHPPGGSSTFVSVVAWIFIVLSGIATLMSVLQNIMINTIFPLAQMRAPSGPGSEHMPAFMRFMFEHLRLIFVSFLLIVSGTLLAAIGLLRRKNWARLAFIAILGLGIVWNVGGLVLQQLMFSSMTSIPSKAPAEFQAEFTRAASIAFGFAAVMAIGFSVLFGWLIKRLLSQPIRAEFT